MIRRKMFQLMGTVAVAGLFSIPALTSTTRAQAPSPCSCCGESCACEDCGCSEACCNAGDKNLKPSEDASCSCCGDSCTCGSCGCGDCC